MARWPELKLAVRCHPAALIGEEEWGVYQLWRLCRGGKVTGRIQGMAAGIVQSDPIARSWPAAGGASDQDAWLMAAFDTLDAADAALTARDLAPKKDG